MTSSSVRQSEQDELRAFRRVLSRSGLAHEHYSDAELLEIRRDLFALVKLFIEIGPSTRR